MCHLLTGLFTFFSSFTDAGGNPQMLSLRAPLQENNSLASQAFQKQHTLSLTTNNYSTRTQICKHEASQELALMSELYLTQAPIKPSQPNTTNAKSQISTLGLPWAINHRVSKCRNGKVLWLGISLLCCTQKW